METLPNERELDALGIFATCCDTEEGYSKSDMIAVLKSKGMSEAFTLDLIVKFPQYIDVRRKGRLERYKPSDRKKEILYDPNGRYYVGEKRYHEGLDMVGTVAEIEDHGYIKMAFTDGKERRMQGKGREHPQ
ncbi:MAG: hypothetical protein HYX24_07345 [Candidatus Aenigmarchaeota archaeon]|nr:hypothetical protein [Candidatus Aenigmarchaeota archaeon]